MVLFDGRGGDLEPERSSKKGSQKAGVRMGDGILNQKMQKSELGQVREDFLCPLATSVPIPFGRSTFRTMTVGPVYAAKV